MWTLPFRLSIIHRGRLNGSQWILSPSSYKLTSSEFSCLFVTGPRSRRKETSTIHARHPYSWYDAQSPLNSHCSQKILRSTCTARFRAHGYCARHIIRFRSRAHSRNNVTFWFRLRANQGSPLPSRPRAHPSVFAVAVTSSIHEQRLVSQVARKVEKVDARALHAVLVNLQSEANKKKSKQIQHERTRRTKKESSAYKVRRDPAREQRALVRLRQPRQQRLQPDLLHERLRDRAAHHAVAARHVVVQVRVLELRLQVVERARQLVRDDRARLRAPAALELAPDARELGRGVLRDLLLDVAHVALVERGRLAVLEDHQVDVVLRGEREPGEDFQGGARDAACGHGTNWVIAVVSD